MSNIALIDADSIIYLSVYNKDPDYIKTKEDVFTCCDRYIKDILDKTESEYYSGFLTDGSFRYKIAKQKPYKGNRIGIPKPKYFNLAKAYLVDEYKFTTVKDYEADDLCIMAHNTFKTNKAYEPYVASPDKDLKQIAGKFYDYKKGELIELNEEDANKNLWKQVLTGDTGDDITGLQGIGPVKADRILKNSTDYKTSVLNEYTKAYGEYNGILNFTETYQLVKMLNKINNEFYYPEVYKYEKTEIDEWFK